MLTRNGPIKLDVKNWPLSWSRSAGISGPGLGEISANKGLTYRADSVHAGTVYRLLTQPTLPTTHSIRDKR